MKILFLFISCLTGIICLGLAYFLALRPNDDKSARFTREPRWLGTLVGAICLTWAAYHGVQMLEGDLEKFRPIAWGLVPVTVVLSYPFLDYINARVLGGFLTLAANHLINGAFVFDVPGRAFYSIICLILGVIGMIGIGLPWRYRDLIDLARQKAAIRKTCLLAFGIAGIVLIIMPWFARL
ncbi:MAG: hypothetical protein J6X55_04715 [Victivallales bacterium]|nr:hypothetical protein [Victivallales bacterium]